MSAHLPYPGSTYSPAVPRNDDTQQRLEWKIACILSSGLGLGGVVGIAGPASRTGRFWIFHALTDCVIGAVAYMDGSTFVAGTTLKAGDRIYGRMSALTLTSGTGELYKAVGV
jgi:hypothetical protein